MKWFRRLAVCALPLVALGLGSAGGCSASDDLEDLDDILDEDGGVDVTEEIEEILAVLFPDLTEEEIAELAADLSLEAAIDLRVELEAIRESVEEFSRELFTTAEERVEEREADLESENGGFPLTVEPVGRMAYYDASSGQAWIDLSGVFSGQSAIQLTANDVTIDVDGQAQTPTLECLYDGSTVDIVFLVDITGSMSNVIGSVRRSLVRFVDAIVASGVRGTIGVVSFQDSVGVNVSFQESAPPNDYERSPFFEPVPIDDADEVEELQRFITRLEANRGADAPENLAGAIDFARNNVIGVTGGTTPNVIGDGTRDPAGTEAWPALTSERQVFVAFTDITFHGDSRDEDNSSLLNEFKPRPAATILQTLQETGTVVHVSDPSWIDEEVADTSGTSVDSDYWAINTGGLGEDVVVGYSLVDLELVVVASETGLLDITLDSILETSCRASFDLPSLAAGATFDLTIEANGEVFTESMTPVRL